MFNEIETWNLKPLPICEMKENFSLFLIHYFSLNGPPFFSSIIIIIIFDLSPKTQIEQKNFLLNAQKKNISFVIKINAHQ